MTPCRCTSSFNVVVIVRWLPAKLTTEGLMLIIVFLNCPPLPSLERCRRRLMSSFTFDVKGLDSRQRPTHDHIVRRHRCSLSSLFVVVVCRRHSSSPSFVVVVVRRRRRRSSSSSSLFVVVIVRRRRCSLSSSFVVVVARRIVLCETPLASIA